MWRNAMKSAFELAMERLDRESGPTKKLSAKQKAEIAEIDKKFDAKAAACKLGHEAAFAKATSLEEFEALKAAMAAELTSFEQDRNKAKEAVWNAS